MNAVIDNPAQNHWELVAGMIREYPAYQGYGGNVADAVVQANTEFVFASLVVPPVEFEVIFKSAGVVPATTGSFCVDADIPFRPWRHEKTAALEAVAVDFCIQAHDSGEFYINPPSADHSRGRL